MTGRAIVFAGGGTGGHIFPALAVAEQVRARDPRASCVFLCSDKPLDAQILARRGEACHPLPARPFALRPRGLYRLMTGWGPSIRAARAVLRDLAREHHVTLVAMGGYVAAPAVQAARAEGVAIALVNLDAVPGLANRWIARRASWVVTALAVPGRSWDVVGPIVRAEAVAGGSPPACRAELGLDPDRPTLLVTGGSLGAESVNRALIALASARPEVLRGWQVVHQSGGKRDGELADAYRDAGVPALVRPFFEAMAPCWGAADLGVTRCGAGTVMEAWANRVPCLMLPYPHHADEHQRRNAGPLVAAGAALLRTDHVDPDANLGAWGDDLARLLTDPQMLGSMRAACSALGPADGAQRVSARLGIA